MTEGARAPVAAAQGRAAALQLLADSDLIASAEVIDATIDRLAAEISGRYAETYPIVLVVMTGAVVFAGRLLPKLAFPLELDYVHATRYGASISGTSVRWKVEPPAAVRGRPVLVLDDILDGGHTLLAIFERLREAGAESVQLAVLVEKELAGAKPIAADFVGLRIPDRFVFGCGMDAKGMWRNLPEIRAMRGA